MPLDQRRQRDQTNMGTIRAPAIPISGAFWLLDVSLFGDLPMLALPFHEKSVEYAPKRNPGIGVVGKFHMIKGCDPI